MSTIKELSSLTQDLKVLYVEDDPIIQAKMKKYLQKFFFFVGVADDGVSGLALFKKEDFHIVITDLSMPNMDGIEMIKQIKKIKENQAVLITTAHTDSVYLLDAIKSHVDGYILKPFDYDDLNQELLKISLKIQTFHKNEEYKQYLQEMLDKQRKEMDENYEKTLYSIVELIEQRDTYTAGHSKRVAYYCKIIAQEMGYNEDECTLIHQAGILHDVGKIETPDAVLLNPKILNDLEYKLIQEHVEVGYKLLNSIPMFKPLSVIVRSHHERYDGSGYPKGLKGDAIHYLARIMIVADAFDAMTTSRIYKARKQIKEALTELVNLSGTQFDPKVIKDAIKVLEKVNLDENINQLPTTKLEQERFAYFYNDTLSPVYNQNYLSVNLLKNGEEFYFTHMVVFGLSDFSSYNKKHGWKHGDKILEKFAKILFENLEGSSIFRIFGDDFVVLSKGEIVVDTAVALLDNLTSQEKLSYKIKQIDLKKQSIKSLSDIEKLLN